MTPSNRHEAGRMRRWAFRHSRVARVWTRAGIQPHLLRGYMVSTDPEFEEKAVDIIGLYLKPPLNAALFCVDERVPSKIQRDLIARGMFCSLKDLDRKFRATSAPTNSKQHPSNDLTKTLPVAFGPLWN